MRNIRIGDYLVEQKLITQEQLQQVLAAQKENGGKRFGETVVELGFISEVSLSKALAAKLRVPYVDLG
ncbi:MAG: type II secretion system protein GspE, partial [Oscillospiraceae bacterium]|nr:type II secretion system protein GspE [Oscillospiraceae bacterium]